MRQGFSYSYISAWASRCLSSFEGQCEGLKCGVSDKWPRFFCICWFIGFTNTLNINQMNTRRILMLCVWLFAITFMRAQVPQAISYQAVAYDEEGNVLSNKAVSVQLEILQGSISGAVVYQEVHRAATSSNGVLNLRIGQGETAEYDFSSIDWSQAPYFVRLSMDTQGGDAYKEVAVSQMLSVPYALYAEKAGSVENAEEKIIKFRVYPVNGPGAGLLTGARSQYFYFYSSFSLYVDYLDEPNQEVQFEVIGLPEGVTIEPYSSGDSGPLGLYISLQPVGNSSNAAPGVYDCTFRLWNKYGYVREYPFRYEILPLQPVEGDPENSDNIETVPELENP